MLETKKKRLRKNELGPKAKASNGYLYARASGCVSIPSALCATVIRVFIRREMTYEMHTITDRK